MKRPEAKDRFGLVYGILVVLGVGTMLPFNVFMTEAEFFNVRLHVPPFQSAVSDNFISLFGLCFNSFNLLAIVVMLWLQKGWSLRTQVVNPLLVILLVMASTGLVALRLDLSGEAVAAYSLPAMAVNGMCMAVLQGGLLNLASMFPPIYIQGYIVGAGLSGVATSLLSFFSQLEASQEDDSAAVGMGPTPAEVAPAAAFYFGAASAIIAACVAAYSALTRLEYSRQKLGPYIVSRRAALEGSPDLLERLLPPPPDPLDPPLKPANPDALPSYGAAGSSSSFYAGGAAPLDALRGWEGEPDHSPPTGRPPSLTALEFYRRQHPGSTAFDAQLLPLAMGGQARVVRGAAAFVTYSLCIVLTMAASMAVWPGVTGFMCSVDNPAATSPCVARVPGLGRLAGDLFVPATFVAFGLGDVCGRISSSWGPWGAAPPHPAALALYTLARSSLAAALLFCNVVTPQPWSLPLLVTSDAAALGLIFLLGLTQGHLLSTACMHAPAVVPPGKEAEFGPVTGFCITSGCLLGSCGSFLLVRALAGLGG